MCPQQIVTHGLLLAGGEGSSPEAEPAAASAAAAAWEGMQAQPPPEGREALPASDHDERLFAGGTPL